MSQTPLKPLNTIMQASAGSTNTLAPTTVEGIIHRSCLRQPVVMISNSGYALFPLTSFNDMHSDCDSLAIPVTVVFLVTRPRIKLVPSLGKICDEVNQHQPRSCLVLFEVSTNSNFLETVMASPKRKLTSLCPLY